MFRIFNPVGIALIAFYSPCSLRPYTLVSLVALVALVVLSPYCLTPLRTYGYAHIITLEDL
jgi:ABC-type transport system involved in cytochrome bd biosynthesis fused ATPase/permease subunit